MSFSNVPAEGDPFDDKPSFYLEGTVGINEIDAGLQYEPRTIDTYKPGWAAFISIARGRNRSVFCNPKVVERSSGDSIAWRGGVAPTDGKAINSSISSSVTYTAHPNGMVSATIGALRSGGRVGIVPNSGTFFYNRNELSRNTRATRRHPIAPWSGNNPVSGNRSRATIKRVTAMTRSHGGSELDGSSLSCTWRGSLGAPVDQSRTGYDSPPNRASDNDASGTPDASFPYFPYLRDDPDKDGRGNYKVDFPSLNVSRRVARTDSSASRAARQELFLDRYSVETVNINLRNPVPIGKGGIGLR